MIKFLNRFKKINEFDEGKLLFEEIQKRAPLDEFLQKHEREVMPLLFDPKKGQVLQLGISIGIGDDNDKLTYLIFHDVITKNKIRVVVNANKESKLLTHFMSCLRKLEGRNTPIYGLWIPQKSDLYESDMDLIQPFIFGDSFSSDLSNLFS
ncbi:MAG: hypothetical protein ACTSP4_10600 [Candidatus Hodarchaeales archaeon]